MQVKKKKYIVKIKDMTNKKLEINEIQPLSICIEETIVDTTNRIRIPIFNLVKEF